MPADIIVYALIAAGLVFWLRNVLGTRHGDERQRPSPYIAGEKAQPQDLENSFFSEEGELNAKGLISQLAEDPKGAMSIANDDAKDGLFAIAGSDRNFDIMHFLEGAQDAFVIIVESFAAGDRETLSGLLDSPVYDAFEAVISEREEKEETHESEIHSIKKAEVLEARIKGKMAFITVLFVAEETALVKDKDGEITSGHPDKVTEMRDIWVFGRDIKSRDPRWLVYETRGDFEGDNETIPDVS